MIVGINATRALTTKYDAQLSLGRVQTPTIQLVQMRQNEINHFKPQTYYTMKLNAAGLTFHCTKPQSHPDKTVLKSIKKQSMGNPGTLHRLARHIKSISTTII